MPKNPEPQKNAVDLESITLRGKYEIPETDFEVIRNKITEMLKLRDWDETTRIGESVELMQDESQKKQTKDVAGTWQKYLKRIRSGMPVYLLVTALEHHQKSILVEVECHPAMWHIIAYQRGKFIGFTENEVKEALNECKNFIKRIMSVFRGRPIEPVSVYPIVSRTEIKGRLLNLGLTKVVIPLNTAEKHIVQNNFTESLKSSRTAFEKMIDWQMKKRGLGKTNSYRNDLERLKSKGYLGPEITKLLKIYYQCLSIIGVHEKGIEPGIFESQMVYGMTLIMLDYFANKLP